MECRIYYTLCTYLADCRFDISRTSNIRNKLDNRTNSVKFYCHRNGPHGSIVKTAIKYRKNEFYKIMNGLQHFQFCSMSVRHLGSTECKVRTNRWWANKRDCYDWDFSNAYWVLTGMGIGHNPIAKNVDRWYANPIK